MRRIWKRLSGPVKIGLVLGLIGALLTVIGVLKGGFAPLTARSLLLGILIGGGSWGVVSWAIAAAATDAIPSTVAPAASAGGSEGLPAVAVGTAESGSAATGERRSLLSDEEGSRSGDGHQ